MANSIEQLEFTWGDSRTDDGRICKPYLRRAYQ
jgi:hypothetical protein